MSIGETIVTSYYLMIAFLGLKGFAWLLGFGREGRIWSSEWGTYSRWKKKNSKDPRLKEYFPSK